MDMYRKTAKPIHIAMDMYRKTANYMYDEFR